MAIINKFQIRSYKEVIINVSHGTIEDGGLSTFNLDDPSVYGRFGTSDFSGVIKKVVLLGEVIKESLDIKNFPVGRFNQLTQQEFENQLLNGNFVYNPSTRGQAEVIGWVELGNTYPSFYYDNCTTNGKYGKRPKSDNYFELSSINPSIYLVSGQGNGTPALQRVRNWNYEQSIGNWGIQPFPGQSPLGFQEYFISVLSDGFVQGGTVTNLNARRISSIPLLISDYGENFEGNNTYTLSPSFANIESDQSSPEKNVYGRLRRIISEGFKPASLRTNIGECFEIETETVVSDENGGLSSGLIFYVNDSSFTKDYGNESVKSVDENILYNVIDGPLDSNSPSYPRTETPLSKYSYSKNSISLVKPFSNVYNDTQFPPDASDPEQPPTDARPDTPVYVVPSPQRPIDSLMIQSNANSTIIVRVNPFRTVDDSPWKQKKSLNLNFNPLNTQTYIFYNKSDTPIFDTKKRIANFNSINNSKSTEEYKKRLIFIKDEIVKRRNEIIS